MTTLDDIIALRNAAYQQPKVSKQARNKYLEALRTQQRFERFMHFRLTRAWVDLETLYPEVYTETDFPALIRSEQSGTQQGLYFTAFALRKVMCGGSATVVNKAYECGLLGKVVEWVRRSDLPRLQYDSVQIVSAVATLSIKFTQMLISHGLLRSLVVALDSLSALTREEALAALANAASVCMSAADELAEMSTVKQVVELENMTRNQKKYVCWLLSTIAKGRSLDDIRRFAVAFLVTQLKSSEDLEVLTDCCEVLSCLSQREVQALIDSDAVPGLSTLLGSTQYGVQFAALRTLGNLSTGSDTQTAILLNPEVLTPLLKLVDSNRKQIRKEAVWILSNLCTGPTTHITQVVEEGILPKVVSYVSTQDLEVCREACWVLNNIIRYGSREQLQVLLDTPLVLHLCQILAETQVQVLKVALRCIKALLHSFKEKFAGNDDINPMKEMIEASGGVPYIEDLKTHKHPDLQQTASSIMTDFFPTFDCTALSEDEDFLI